MNLWLRVLHLFIASLFRPRLDPVSDVSRLGFRVWPHDLDTSLHMNNGRYWTLMDLGRADIMIRSGLWRKILKHGWVPVVSAGQIRFRRELKLFQPFTLETRIVSWADSWVMMEHRLVTVAKDGSPIVSATALVRVGLYDRKAKSFVSVERMFADLGIQAHQPQPGAEITAFLAAEEAMKKTT
ncbi:acyl-CoA thioesterase [Microvirga flavescens]|uniref:acyl-CoA thioesterase n=1 Tax=Microvirga flavescens TaxID=2249811 RepID=UPI000DD94EFA|nr:thioesterase family protein [Microvirga flavescens]